MEISAQVVLINDKGMVLGVSRKTDHSDFGLAGGKMEAVDQGKPEFTAIREVYEETGLHISNLRLVFAMHKNGNMGYTYLADYKGEINHNEPHIVKWVPFQSLLMGSFGKYNQLVLESLKDMGIKVVENPDLAEVKFKVGEIVERYGYNFIDIVSCRNWFGMPCNEVRFEHADGQPIDEDFYNFSMVSEISKLGDANGIILTVPSEYLPK
jgi:ADP-ribose pyrophosphatase YjhB (NUDIX family)